MKQGLFGTLMLLAAPAAAGARGLPSQNYLPLAMAGGGERDGGGLRGAGL